MNAKAKKKTRVEDEESKDIYDAKDLEEEARDSENHNQEDDDEDEDEHEERSGRYVDGEDEETRDLEEEKEEDKDEDEEEEEKRTARKSSRSVEVVFTTPTPVLRQDENGQAVYEILSMQGCDLTRLQSGRAPFLRDHDNQIDSVLGVVKSARIKNGKGVATIQLSAREEVRGIYEDIKSGILSGVSVGYSVHESKAVEKHIDGVPCRLVTKWEPHEISLVSIPADHNSKVNGVRGLITRTHATLENHINIKRLAKRAGISPDFTRGLLASGMDQGLIARAIKKEMQKRGEKFIRAQNSVVITRDETETRKQGLEQALLYRMNPQKFALTPQARSYADYSLLDIVKSSDGKRDRRQGGLMLRNTPSATSSDFSLLLANVLNKNMRAIFDEAPSSYEPFTKQITVRDFRPTYFMQLSEGGFPEEIAENDLEIKRNAFSEAGEEINPKRFASSYNISREAILSDDLMALSRISQILANAAKSFISREIYKLLAHGDGQTMRSGQPLFCREHKNIGTVGGPITIESLAAARSAMRLQTGLSGRVLNLMPKYLVTSAKRELQAQQLLSQSLLAGVISTLSPEQRVNPFANGSIVHICEPRLDEFSGDHDPYYLIADPSQTDTIVLAYLQDSGPGPQVFSRTEWGARMNVSIELLLEFGVRVLEHRAFYKQGVAPATTSGASSSTSSTPPATEKDQKQGKKETK